MTGTEGRTPLRAVLAALPDARTVTEVAEVTGLPRDVVDAALDHLERSGRIPPRLRLTGVSACPADGCRSCPAAAGCPR